MINADQLDKVTLQIILDRAEAQRAVAGLKGVGQAGAAIGEQTEAGTTKAKRALADLERQSRSLKDQVGASGDSAANIAALNNLARLGGADLGIASDLLDVAENLPLLKENLKGIPAALSAMATALGPVGIAATIAGVALVAVLGNLQKQFEETRAAALADIELQARLKLLREQGTAEDLEAQIKAAQERFDAAHTQVEVAESIIEGFINSFATEAERQIAGDAIRKSIENGVDFTQALPSQVIGAIEAMRGAGPAAESALLELTGLKNTLNSTEVQTRTLNEAEQELSDTRAEAANVLSKSLLQATLEANNLTAKQLEERIKAIAQERNILNDFIQTGKFTGAALEEANRRFGELGEVMGVFLSAVPGARARDRIQAEQDMNSELADAARDYEQKRQSIIDDGNTAALRLQEQYADKVVNITQKFADDIERATERLQERSAELARDVGRESDQAERDAKRERIEEQIAFNQETAKQARDLERELLKIKRDSQAQEADLVRNRDFAGISKLREERNRALDDAVSSFNVEQRERETAFKQQQQQTNRQLEFEAETRRIQFEQAIKDAQLQFETERAIAFRERDKQLKQLQASTAKEAVALQNAQNKRLQLLQDGTVKELKLIQQGEEARLRLRAQADALYLQMARNLIGGIGGLANTTNNTLTNANTFNITSGGGAQQQAGLVNLIAQVVNQQLGNFFN